MAFPRRKRVEFDGPAEALASSVCVCGANKWPDRPFCGECFERLPEKLGRALMHRPAETEVFSTAYERAKELLA